MQRDGGEERRDEQARLGVRELAEQRERDRPVPVMQVGVEPCLPLRRPQEERGVQAHPKCHAAAIKRAAVGQGACEGNVVEHQPADDEQRGDDDSQAKARPAEQVGGEREVGQLLRRLEQEREGEQEERKQRQEAEPALRMHHAEADPLHHAAGPAEYRPTAAVCSMSSRACASDRRSCRSWRRRVAVRSVAEQPSTDVYQLAIAARLASAAGALISATPTAVSW